MPVHVSTRIHDAHATQSYAKLVKSHSLNDSLNSQYFIFPIGESTELGATGTKILLPWRLKQRLFEGLKEGSLSKRLQCSWESPTGSIYVPGARSVNNLLGPAY